jgi:hypothetical protein
MEQGTAVTFNQSFLLGSISILALTIVAHHRGIYAYHPAEQPSANHGLLLTLSRDPTFESEDSDARRDCLGHYPGAACVVLIISLKNEGKETILSFSSSCGEQWRVWFDLLNADGSWQPFPKSKDFRDLPVCTRNVAIARVLSPGESEVRHMRLADDPALRLDSAVRSGGERAPVNSGYNFLVGPGPRTIRAHWAINACIASDKVKPGTDINPLGAGSLCSPGTKPEEHFVDLQSNQLDLGVKSISPQS